MKIQIIIMAFGFLIFYEPLFRSLIDRPFLESWMPGPVSCLSFSSSARLFLSFAVNRLAVALIIPDIISMRHSMSLCIAQPHCRLAWKRLSVNLQSWRRVYRHLWNGGACGSILSRAHINDHNSIFSFHYSLLPLGLSLVKDYLFGIEESWRMLLIIARALHKIL